MSFKKKKLDEVQPKTEEEFFEEFQDLEEHEREYFDPVEGETEEDIHESEESVEPEAEDLECAPELHSKALIRSIRRKANPDSWKQVVRKKLRQAGQEYVNVQGKVMAERRVQEGCGTGCYLKCTQRFTPEQRQLIHNTFWKLTDEQKNNFYWKYTSRVEPKRRRANAGENPKRGCTFKYRFEIRGELLPVCSKFFFGTLDISARRIYYFYEHCYQEDICMPRQPLRGKTRKRSVPNIAARLEEIREHIKSFPSTRLGGSGKKRYLAADLNLTRLYKLYTERAKEPLKQHWYTKVFHEEFNLGFCPSKTMEKNEKTVIKKERKCKTNDQASEINGGNGAMGVNMTDRRAKAITNLAVEPTSTTQPPEQQHWPELSEKATPELQSTTAQVWPTSVHVQAPSTVEEAQTSSQLYPGYVELHWIGDVKAERLRLAHISIENKTSDTHMGQ